MEYLTIAGVWQVLIILTNPDFWKPVLIKVLIFAENKDYSYLSTLKIEEKFQSDPTLRYIPFREFFF